MQAIEKFERSIFPLFHCPRRYNFIRMLPCVVDSKCVPGFEHSLAGNTGVGNVQMDLCMPLNSLPLREGLATTEAEKLTIMSARYHLIHQRIQGCCGHIINTFFYLVTLAGNLFTFGIEDKFLLSIFISPNGRLIHHFIDHEDWTWSP